MKSKKAKKIYVEEMKKNFTDNESVMIAQYQGLNVTLESGLEIKSQDTLYYLKDMTQSCGILDQLQNIINFSLLGFLRRIGKRVWLV